MKLFITEAKRSIAAIKHYWLASLTDLIVYLAGFIFLYVFIKETSHQIRRLPVKPSLSWLSVILYGFLFPFLFHILPTVFIRKW